MTVYARHNLRQDPGVVTTRDREGLARETKTFLSLIGFASTASGLEAMSDEVRCVRDCVVEDLYHICCGGRVVCVRARACWGRGV